MKPIKFTKSQVDALLKDVEELPSGDDASFPWFQAAFMLVTALVSVLIARNSDLIIAMVYAPTS